MNGQENIGSGCEYGCGCDLCNPDAHIIPERESAFGELVKAAKEALRVYEDAHSLDYAALNRAMEGVRLALNKL